MSGNLEQFRLGPPGIQPQAAKKNFKKKISLIADGPHHYHPDCGKDLPVSPRSTPYNFLSRCKFSTLTTRQTMVELYLLTFPRFPLRKKEHKQSYFGKNRTHDSRTSRCAVYLLDHSGDIMNTSMSSSFVPQTGARAYSQHLLECKVLLNDCVAHVQDRFPHSVGRLHVRFKPL